MQGKERFGTFFNEANRSKIDKHFVQSYWSAYQQKKIDKEFTQSYCLALQFVSTKENKPDRIFTVVCHRHPTGKRSRFQTWSNMVIMEI